MKTAISTALALALLGGVAHAQSDQNRQGQDHPKNVPPPPAQHHQQQPPAGNQRPVTAAPNAGGQQRFGGQQRVGGQSTGGGSGVQRGYTGQAGSAGGGQRPYAGQGGNTAGQQGRYSGQGATAGPNGYRGYSGGPRGAVTNPAVRAQRDYGRTQYNSGQWRRSYFAQRRFEGPNYAYPQNWYYRRWGYGEFLPIFWIGANYYLDANVYGLPYPPIGAEWLREGPDAVLVDVRTGQILSVEYGLFY